MKLAQIKNNEGRVSVSEVTNRYGAKEYIVDYKIKGEGCKMNTYKTIESAMKKYNKVARMMNEIYMTIAK